MKSIVYYTFSKSYSWGLKVAFRKKCIEDSDYVILKIVCKLFPNSIDVILEMMEFLSQREKVCFRK